MSKEDERQTARIDSLITPQQLTTELPTSDAITDYVTASRNRIKKILTGENRRLLVVIGPCSIHDPQSAFDYATRLSVLRNQYQDRLEIVMRTYFEKPRTVVGWKGMIFDPQLDGSYNVNQGLRSARDLLIKINELGLPTATEFLDMFTGQYIVDLISWGAIGARTTESQIHRKMASSLPCPIGFKNGTDGNVDIAIDAVRAALNRHVLLSPDHRGQMAIYQTSGNQSGHIILRGGQKPNYHPIDISAACQKLRKCQLSPYLMVDVSHGNCENDYCNQLKVAKNIGHQIRSCHSSSSAIVGVMVESFIKEGAQEITAGKTLTYGQSITDPCLNWEDSEKLLAELADAVNTDF